MLYLYIGTDTERRARSLQSALAQAKRETLRVTDAHAADDVEAALGGGGMFTGLRSVVLDGVCGNEEMRPVVLARLQQMRDSHDTFYIVESALDAATRKQIEKYAEKSEKFDSAKAAKKETIFALANALQSGKKKDLWVGLQHEYAAGKAPEAVHGVLFWAAKQLLLRKPSDMRSQNLVAALAELPHRARREGVELEYALELFALAVPAPHQNQRSTTTSPKD